MTTPFGTESFVFDATQFTVGESADMVRIQQEISLAQGRIKLLKQQLENNEFNLPAGMKPAQRRTQIREEIESLKQTVRDMGTFLKAGRKQ